MNGRVGIEVVAIMTSWRMGWPESLAQLMDASVNRPLSKCSYPGIRNPTGVIIIIMMVIFQKWKDESASGAPVPFNWLRSAGKSGRALVTSAPPPQPPSKITMAIFSSFYWSIVHDFHDCTTLGNRSSVQIRISNAQSESRPSGGGSTSSPGRFINIIDTIRNIYECFWMRSWCSSLFYSLVFFFFSSRIIVSKFDI